jgi:citronellyl-CoA dehydrogenase
MAICVQSNMATPALAEFGSDYLKRQFLAPTISGDMIACLGVSESTAGSDVAGKLLSYFKSASDDMVCSDSNDGNRHRRRWRSNH